MCGDQNPTVSGDLGLLFLFHSADCQTYPTSRTPSVQPRSSGATGHPLAEFGTICAGLGVLYLVSLHCLPSPNLTPTPFSQSQPHPCTIFPAPVSPFTVSPMPNSSLHCLSSPLHHFPTPSFTAAWPLTGNFGCRNPCETCFIVPWQFGIEPRVQCQSHQHHHFWPSSAAGVVMLGMELRASVPSPILGIPGLKV